MEKEDRRVRKTKAAIAAAFWQLANDMPISSITIKDICEKADIYRSSFYFHYPDLPSLLDALEEQAADIAMGKFDVMYTVGNYTEAMIDGFVELIRRDEHIRLLLISDCNDHKGGRIFAEKLKNKVLPYWLSHSEMKADEAEALYAYSIMGSFEVMRMWCETKFAMPEETVKRILSGALTGGIFAFVKPTISNA